MTSDKPLPIDVWDPDSTMPEDDWCYADDARRALADRDSYWQSETAGSIPKTQHYAEVGAVRVRLEDACRELEAHRKEKDAQDRLVAQLRRILIDSINETDGWCHEDVQLGFLCGLPSEVAAIKKERDRAKARVVRLEAAVRDAVNYLEAVPGARYTASWDLVDRLVAELKEGR